MGEMRDSDWSRKNLLRSDWLGPKVAPYTTQYDVTSRVGDFQNGEQSVHHCNEFLSIV